MIRVQAQAMAGRFLVTTALAVRMKDIKPDNNEMTESEKNY